MKPVSRRHILESTLAASAATFSGLFTGSSVAGPYAQGSQETVRDRLWIFTVVAGMNNDRLEDGGVRGGSRMTPAEGAFYLGVPNLIMVRERGLPHRPSHEKNWKARTSFEQYAISFRPLKRVVWSVVGSGGNIQGDEVSWLLELAGKFPNISGVYLDDFFQVPGNGDRAEFVAGLAGQARIVTEDKRVGTLSPTELKSARDRLVVGGRRLEMWLTLYTQQINPSHPEYVTLDRPFHFYLDHFDVITLWTWNSDELRGLEQNFERLEKLSPGSGKALGCYLWDFYNRKPVPVPLMEHQCKLGLKWLQEGRIKEIVFLANTVLDVGLEVVEWTRDWIQKVGDDPLG